MPRPKRSPSVSSGAPSSDSDGAPSDTSMTSRRSKDSRKSNATSVSADNSCYDDRSVDAPRRGRGWTPRIDCVTSRRPDIKSNSGLTRLVQTTIAKLKRKGGCPVTAIKQEIKDCYGYALTGTHNTKRLIAVLKKLTKEGVLQKRGKSYSVAPASVLRRRRRHHHHGKHRHHHRRRRRRRKSRSKKAKKGKKRHRRRRHRVKHKKRKHSRRRTRRRRISKSRRSRGKKPKPIGRRRKRGRRAVAPKTRRLRRGVSTLAPSIPAPIPGPSRGGFVPGGGSPRVPSRNASRVPSRAPSHLPSRSHSPARPGFDPRETPPTRSRRGSARASARNSPGPHLIDGLDDFDL